MVSFIPYSFGLGQEFNFLSQAFFYVKLFELGVDVALR